MLTAVLGAAILISACQPTPPTSSSKITATTAATAECGYQIVIEGTTDPTKPTPNVVLQRTVDGKWQDWLWYQTWDSDESPHRVTATVEQRTGKYYMFFRAPITPGRTHSLRVRSAGGSAWSNTVWVKIVAPPQGCPSTL